MKNIAKYQKKINKWSVILREGKTVWNTLQKSGYGLSQIKLKSYPYIVNFRQSTQDVDSIIQVLVRKEFGAFKHIDPVNIVDAGGYIGDTAIYFLTRYKNSRCIVLEPNKSNYNIAKLNLELFGNRVYLNPNALWYKNAQMNMNGDFLGASLNNKGNEKEKVSCITIPQLMNEYNINHIDLLKLNIEGSEHDLILKNNQWLCNTQCIIAQLHSDAIKKDCLRVLFQFGFRSFQY